MAEPIFGGGLRTGWEDLASESGGANDGGPRRLELTGPRGWILTNSKLRGSWGGLVFRFRASATFGDFFEVRLDSDTAELFPRVLVSPRHRKELEGGWSEAFIPMNELNPRGAAFIRLVLRSVRPLPSPGLVELDGVGLTQSDPNVSVQPDQVASALGMPTVFVVDCSAQPSPISPLIYGLGFSPSQEFPPPSSWRLKPTARRWGGVAASRYNWELGSAWNPGAEGFFQNVNLVGRPDFSWRTFLEIDVDRGVKTALTVPMVGWVAKDMTSAGFPVAEYGKQEQESDRGGGNGIARDGTLLKPSTPLRTSVPAPPDFIGQWVTAIKAFEKKHGPAVSLYQLDDEPDRWAVTHRDVHPSPVTYDELLERTVGYASAIRKADPTAVIAGPALSGWVASQLSAEDLAAGPGKKPDRLAHGDVALIEWFLAKLAAHEKRTGLKPLDVLDLHYFPTAKAIGRGVDGATDPQTNALRIQATRSNRAARRARAACGTRASSRRASMSRWPSSSGCRSGSTRMTLGSGCRSARTASGPNVTCRVAWRWPRPSVTSAKRGSTRPSTGASLRRARRRPTPSGPFATSTGRAPPSKRSRCPTPTTPRTRPCSPLAPPMAAE